MDRSPGPWHIVAPLVWSLIVELYARDVLGELREVRRLDTDRIPLRLWLSAPSESLRTSWRMARTGERSAEQARVSADRCAAARDALQRALPGRRHRRSRRQITRRLWAGSIDAADVFAAIGWTDQPGTTQAPPPEQIIRTALRSVLGPVGSDASPSSADSPTEPAPIPDLELVAPPPLDDLDDPSDDVIEDA